MNDIEERPYEESRFFCRFNQELGYWFVVGPDGSAYGGYTVQDNALCLASILDGMVPAGAETHHIISYLTRNSTELMLWREIITIKFDRGIKV